MAGSWQKTSREVSGAPLDSGTSLDSIFVVLQATGMDRSLFTTNGTIDKAKLVVLLEKEYGKYGPKNGGWSAFVDSLIELSQNQANVSLDYQKAQKAAGLTATLEESIAAKLDDEAAKSTSRKEKIRLENEAAKHEGSATFNRTKEKATCPEEIARIDKDEKHFLFLIETNQLKTAEDIRNYMLSTSYASEFKTVVSEVNQIISQLTAEVGHSAASRQENLGIQSTEEGIKSGTEKSTEKETAIGPLLDTGEAETEKGKKSDKKPLWAEYIPKKNHTEAS